MNYGGLALPITEKIGRMFGVIPEVDRVYVAARGRALLVWVVLSSFEYAVRDNVLDLQLAVVDRFPELEFSFHAIRSSGEEPSTELGCDAVLAWEKRIPVVEKVG